MLGLAYLIALRTQIT